MKCADAILREVQEEENQTLPEVRIERFRERIVPWKSPCRYILFLVLASYAA